MHHRRPRNLTGHAWLLLRVDDGGWINYHPPGYTNGATARRALASELHDAGHPDPDRHQPGALVLSYVTPDGTHVRAVISDRRPPANITPPAIAPCRPDQCHPDTPEPFTHALGHDPVGVRLSGSLRTAGAMDTADIHALWLGAELSDLRGVGTVALQRLDDVMTNHRPPIIERRPYLRGRAAVHRHVAAIREILANDTPGRNTDHARAALARFETAYEGRD